MVRVSVTKVIYANAKVPVPTCEVATVGEAPNNFIQWPKRLLKLTSKKKYDAQPIKCLYRAPKGRYYELMYGYKRIKHHYFTSVAHISTPLLYGIGQQQCLWIY
ncbi:hypothetical protein P8452_32746 [Trifolium repens]|nr:hypothetical protein P8452_32746 [Trifolium repens]